MADRDSIYAWLASASYRHVYPNDPAYGIVQRLIAEGRATRDSPHSSRVFALPRPPKSAGSIHRTEKR